MRRLIIVLLIAAAGLSNACIASRKFVRNEVKTSSDALSARIDANESDIKEAHDGVNRVDQRVTGVDQRVTGVDEKLTRVTTEQSQRMDGINTQVQQVQTTAQRTGTEVAALDQRFQNRNNFSVSSEKQITFKFDSATLDPAQQPILDEIAATLTQNRDAVVVLEGRTDNTGDSTYNIRLGERRVEAVRRYLAVEKDVPVYKIHEISFGSAQPLVPNDSRENREKNRAVAITILVPSGQTASNSTAR